MQKSLKLFAILGAMSAASYGASVEIPMYLTNESHTLAGNITATDTKYGVMFSPNLTGLVPDLAAGVHGFHVHEKGSCADMGMAAGGHLDPKKTKTHLGPYNPKGHMGDLPALYINGDGTLSIPVVAPRLKVKDILGRSLMIHNGGDNYADEPQPLGGGGKRMVCGVIPAKATAK
ncbi:MAG TPA: superoxide dismutase family protein [Aquella sp.]|nr:superoxide dismutase family protein [Aquella sp.]